MIVVNLKRSMRRLTEQVRLGIPDDVLLEQLKHDTTTEWAGVSSDALYEYGGTESNDYLVGVSGDRIVSIYYITGWHNGQQPGRIVFDVAPAVGMAGAIGQPAPGGPWKRGEARPVRYFDTRSFVGELADRGVLEAYDDAGDDAVDLRMVEVIRDLASPAAQSPLEGVIVETDPRGGVRLTVPLGTKVTVVQRANG